MKSYFKEREKGTAPNEALRRVSDSRSQLQEAGATPKRVPEAPRNTDRGLLAGQRLSVESPSAGTKLQGFAKKLAKLGPLGTAIGVGTGVMLLMQGEPWAAVREFAGALPGFGDVLDTIEIGMAVGGAALEFFRGEQAPLFSNKLKAKWGVLPTPALRGVMDELLVSKMARSGQLSSLVQSGTIAYDDKAGGVLFELARFW
jgi:hypothetical protein